MATISSPSNPIIKDILRLKKSGERKKQDLFIIDGWREIDLAVKSGWEIKTLFYCPELIKKNNGGAGNVFNLEKEKIIEVSAAVFSKISYKEKPEGFLALAKAKKRSLSDIKLNQNSLLIILEQVEKPGNLGAILRTAYAAGVTAVIINDNQTDIYNPNVIRASEGQIFTQEVVSASVAETVGWLKDNKIISLAAATSGSKKYTEAILTGPVALVFGSEAEGLSPEWLRAADKLIKIPMKEGIDSLNVSVSVAIILFEALRQRDI